VELAGALGEIANDTLRNDFRSIFPPDSRIVLLEAMERILPTYPPQLSRAAVRQLERLGVRVRTRTRVVGIDEHSVTVEAEGSTERIPAKTVLWAAGVQASSFAAAVAASSGAEPDRSGRLSVEADLTLAGHPEIFVVGDLAIVQPPDGRPVPGVAPAAIQEGTYAARTILRRLRGEHARAFRYFNKGDVAVIGRLAGVASIPWLGPFGRLRGFVAWVMWLTIHIFYLIGFANRIVVTIRWAWSFFTRGRSTRLITGDRPLPSIESPEPVGSVEHHHRAEAVTAAHPVERGLDVGKSDATVDQTVDR
jgi:NADH dehydrogenase